MRRENMETYGMSNLVEIEDLINLLDEYIDKRIIKNSILGKDETKIYELIASLLNVIYSSCISSFLDSMKATFSKNKEALTELSQLFNNWTTKLKYVDEEMHDDFKKDVEYFCETHLDWFVSDMTLDRKSVV